MAEPDYSTLSTPDFEAFRAGNYGAISDDGIRALQTIRAGAQSAPPMLSPPGAPSPSAPLAPPSGGSITPGQVGAFALDYGLPMAGQTAGAMLGGAVGAPLGPMGSVLGATVLGGAGATAGRDLSNYLTGKPPQTMPERATEFGMGAATELGGAALTRGVAAGARRMLGTATDAASPRTAETMALAERYGVPLSGGQLTGSAPLQAIEQIPARYPIGAKQVVEFGENQRAAAARAVQDLQAHATAKGRAVVGKEELTATGQAVGKKLSAAAEAAKAHYDALYTAAERSAGGTTIPGPGRLQATAAYLAKEGLVPQELQAARAVKAAKGAAKGREATPAEIATAKAEVSRLDTILGTRDPDALMAIQREIEANPSGFRDIIMNRFKDLEPEAVDILTRLSEPRPMTYGQTRDLFHRLEDEVSRLQRAGKDYQAGKLIDIKRAITQDIELAAQATGGDFAAKLKAANQYASDVYFAQFGPEAMPTALREAAKKNPELVVSRILNSGPEGIREIRTALGNGAEYRTVQSQVLQDMATRAFASVEEVGGRMGQRFSVSKWLSLTEGQDSLYRMDRLKALLEPNQVATIQELNKLFRVIQQGGSTFYGANTSGTAGAMLSNAQLLGLVGGTTAAGYAGARGDTEGAIQAAKATALLAAGPALLSRVILSKNGIDMVSKGITRAKFSAANPLAMAGPSVRMGMRGLTTPLTEAFTAIPPMDPTGAPR